MGFIDEISKMLGGHIQTMDKHLQFHGAALHQRLHSIEHAISDLGRPDFGDKYFRIVVKKKIEAGEIGTAIELYTVPINEIFLIQSIAADGVQEKSPAYILNSNGILIESIIKEGLGFEGIGGNQVLLPGETLELVPRAAGSINCVITVVRKVLPSSPMNFDKGIGTERVSPRTLHDPRRDEILSRTSTYVEQPAEIAPTEGHTG